MRCCGEKVGEVHLQVEGWGSQAILWGSHPFPTPPPGTVLIVEGAGALQMGKMRWRVSLFGDPRMEFEPGLPSPYTKKHRKRIVLKMEKTRGLQIIQIYYCKAHKLPQINGEEGRTSSWWPLSLTSPSPIPLPQVSPEYPLVPSAGLLALLLTVLPASSLPWLTLSPPYCYYLSSFLSCFGAGDQIFFLPLVRSSVACSSFQWDSLSCHTCEMSSGSPQRSHILPRKMRDRLTGSILEDRIHDGTANARLGEPHCKRAVCVLSRYVRLFASPWTVAQAKRLEWVAISSYRRSPLPRD